ncbi:hypothetical protein H6B15_13120 [Gemmiger formicilis]|uniref:hypothetical protein n=1 Tax=Gemmiger formicilis TaxID=745368 RepID=UPI0019563FAB|nr:hypothetical protein [Gemmiger formicilis]MBM6717597.1 hypothetical protein [Gemmiger formicilis]
MKSLHARFLSLGLAVAMLLGVTGCTVSTPSSVGSIGGVEIPAGIYLLAQYNAYKTVSGLADLATGETADDVKAVLKAQCTGTIGDEEVTTDGADYLERLTLRNLQYYAAVEAKFDELGATLDDAATAEAADTAASEWESDGDVYTANGISQATLEQYELNSAKADACLELIYGENGQTPVTDEEYIDFLYNDCRYVDVVQLPLFDSASYAFADEDQNAQIQALAQECADTLNGWASAESGRTERFTSMYEAADQYVAQAMEVLGATPESGMGAYYVGSQLLTPETLKSYGTTLTDALDAAGKGVWTTVDLGMSIGVMCDVDPLEADTLQNYKDTYDLLSLLKGDELQDQFYADGAAMEQNLDASAMKTYKASNIKTTA